MKTLAIWLSGIVALALSLPGLTQPYPSRPIRVIVAMPPGAGQDIMLRKIGEELTPRIGQQKAGKLRFLAVGSSKRLRLLPDVPTLDELNIKEKPRAPWVAIGAPAATPDNIVARLNTELGRVFAEPKSSTISRRNTSKAFTTRRRNSPPTCAATARPTDNW